MQENLEDIFPGVPPIHFVGPIHFDEVAFYAEHNPPQEYTITTGTFKAEVLLQNPND